MGIGNGGLSGDWMNGASNENGMTIETAYGSRLPNHYSFIQGLWLGFK